MTINFYLNNKMNKNKTFTIIGYVYGGNSSVVIKTGIKIKLSFGIKRNKL